MNGHQCHSPLLALVHLVLVARKRGFGEKGGNALLTRHSIVPRGDRGELFDVFKPLMVFCGSLFIERALHAALLDD